MIESSTFNDEEYRKVESALERDITLAINNQKRTIIFDPQRYTTIRDPKIIGQFRVRAGGKAYSLPMVKSVEWGQIKNFYECTCHQNCRTVEAIFRFDKLKCGERCDIWSNMINMLVFTKCRYQSSNKPRCNRWRVRRKYNVKDHHRLLRIYL